MARTSLVIGGGFVGLSTALHLQRLGRRVLLLDRHAISSATAAASYGNAGTMAVYANVPVNSPSVLRNLPGMLLDSDGPLSVKPTLHLPSMLPWAALFALHCRRSAVEHTADALGALLQRAESGYEPVFEQAGVDIDAPMGVHASGGDDAARQPFAVREGYLLLQRTEAAMQASAAGAALRRRGLGDGLRMHALSSDEVLELEPALSAHVCAGGAWFFPDGWLLSEPAALMRALAAGFEAHGGELLVGSAVSIGEASSGGGGRGGGVVVRLSDGSSTETVDEVVVAAGAHSKPLVASVGEWCPLDTERGYHVAFAPGSEARLTRGVCDPTEGFIASPMAGGLRVAGKVELGGVDAPPTPARWEQIERASQAMIAGVGPRVPSADWLGFRPSMPDALPVIGRSRKLPSVLYAFGHQHIGWTLGGITGQLVAELADGRGPSVDLHPYRLGRFWPFGG